MGEAVEGVVEVVEEGLEKGRLGERMKVAGPFRVLFIMDGDFSVEDGVNFGGGWVQGRWGVRWCGGLGRWLLR